jgi:hypothetical protein
MELKDIRQEIRELNLGLTMVQSEMLSKLMHSYGQSQYNAALDRAAENAEVKTVWYDEDNSAEVDKDSILNLKITNK